jgi:hypothetical protein
MSREYTEDEVRKNYLELVWEYINYWDSLPEKTCRERLEGLAFGMLVILDGESTEMPGFSVFPSPHQDDKEYHIKLGENWYPDSCDIAGCLHELFYEYKR